MKYTTLPVMLFILSGLFSSISQATPQANSWQKPLISSSYIQLAQSGGKTLNEAVESVKQQTGGRILSAKTVNKNGQRIHKIKVLLPSGKVRIFQINAQ